MKLISDQDLRNVIEYLQDFAKMPCDRNDLRMYNRQRKARLLIDRLKRKAL